MNGLVKKEKVAEKKDKPVDEAAQAKRQQARHEKVVTFNPDWNFSNLTSDKELWQIGSPEQRRIVLQQLLGL